MRITMFAAALALTAIAAPVAGQAQVVNGTVNGANRGADQGEAMGGPVGGIVGGVIGAGVGAATGAVGAATGIVGGVLGAEERPRFREWAEHERHPSFVFREPVRIGAVLPSTGVTYYEVPPEYRARPDYRYAIVNDRPVLVEPRTRRIVDIIE